MDDDDLTMGVDDWYDYCKKMFRKVTKNDLIEFENKYKGNNGFPCYHHALTALLRQGPTKRNAI